MQVTKDMRKAGVRYNDPEDTKIKSHAILWLYRTYTEQTRKAGKGGQVKRCILLGSVPINLADLMQYIVRAHEEDSFAKVMTTVTCKHNFCDVSRHPASQPACNPCNTARQTPSHKPLRDTARQAPPNINPCVADNVLYVRHRQV